MSHRCLAVAFVLTLSYIFFGAAGNVHADILSDASSAIFGGESTTSNLPAADCTGLKLVAAAGFPEGAKHQYAFKGTCLAYYSRRTDGKEVSKSMVETLWAEAKAEWDAQASVLKEVVKLENPKGPYSGEVSAVYKCAKDPVVNKIGCAVFSHNNTTHWEPFSYAALNEKRPIIQGKTSLAEATALSKAGGSKAATTTTPPPPPAVKEQAPQRTLKSPSTAAVANAIPVMFTVEAEQLVATGKALVNGGRIAVQQMAGFGQGWNNNAQLFWSGGAVGAVLDLAVDVPAAATYAVEVYLTRAPDYANLNLEVDGKPSALQLSGYSTAVMAPTPAQAGKFSLQAGQKKVSFMITGKYQQSTNYFVGIDRIVFYPAGAP